MIFLKPAEINSDQLYKNLMGNDSWADSRAYLELMYSKTSDLLDSNFTKEFSIHPHERFSELYFSAVCRQRLNIPISHQGDKGLDFYLNQHNAWVECVAPSDGEAGNENSIPDVVLGKSRQFPDRQFMLRMSAVFHDKAKKSFSDICKGLVGCDEPIVLFINAGALVDGCLVYPHPKLFNVLCGFGELRFSFDAQLSKVNNWKYENKLVLEKLGSPKDIGIGYFFNEFYSHISAVIYSWANLSAPFLLSEIGRDFHILHNPNALNKLPYGFIPCGKEFYIKEAEGEFSLAVYKIHDPDPI